MPIDVKQFPDRAKQRVYDKVDERQYFLVLTNGEVTEKVYFERFKDKLHKGMLLNVEFKNKSPEGLYKVAERFFRNQSIVYDEIWVIFDKDDFDCFEDTVKTLSNDKKFNVAFSNECFEIWLLLHFGEVHAMHRDEASQLLTDKINSHNCTEYRRSQLKQRININDILDIVENTGNRTDAIARATKLQSGKDDDVFSHDNPSTTVYKLVEKLDQILGQ